MNWALRRIGDGCREGFQNWILEDLILMLRKDRAWREELGPASLNLKETRETLKQRKQIYLEKQDELDSTRVTLMLIVRCFIQKLGRSEEYILLKLARSLN